MVPKLNEGGQRPFQTLPTASGQIKVSVMEHIGWWNYRKGVMGEERKNTLRKVGLEKIGEGFEFLNKGQFKKGVERAVSIL